MTMLSVIPQEFFDGVPVPPAVSLDGELLGAVDRSRLTTFELALVSARLSTGRVVGERAARRRRGDLPTPPRSCR